MMLFLCVSASYIDSTNTTTVTTTITQQINTTKGKQISNKFADVKARSIYQRLTKYQWWILFNSIQIFVVDTENDERTNLILSTLIMSSTKADLGQSTIPEGKMFEIWKGLGWWAIISIIYPSFS